MFQVSVPIRVPITNKKWFSLNLNQYRNAHHFELSKAKNVFHDIVAPLLSHLPLMPRVNLLYTLFVGSKQLVDTNNVCSIVDKFFSDVLVNAGKIPDDNCHIVVDTKFAYGGIDKFDPRVEVTVTPLWAPDESPETKTKERPMQITLVQTEIEDAIRNYVNSQLVVREGMRIDIDLSATRGPQGFTAMIDIVSDEVAPTNGVTSQPEDPAPQLDKAVAATPRTRRASAKPEPQAEPEVVEANNDVAEAPDQPVAEAEDTSEDVPSTSAPKRSLFAAQTQPKND
jgi:hypothetical protein